MEIRINGFVMEKATQEDNVDLPETDHLLPIKIVAHQMTQDKDGHVMTKAAFDDETVKYFLTKGDIDWFHKSRKTQDPQYLLGKPKHFMFKAGIPHVFGYLFKQKPIVRDEIIPMLKSGLSDVLEASMGGFFRKLEGPYVKKMVWDHIALAPSSLVRSEVWSDPNPVALLKAGESKVLSYTNIGSFETDIQKNTLSVMYKALEAEAVTDMRNPGHSLGPAEGLTWNIESKDMEVLANAIELFKNGLLSPKKDSIISYLRRNGVSDDKMAAVMKQFATTIKLM